MLSHATAKSDFQLAPPAIDFDAVLRTHGQMVRRIAWQVQSRMSKSAELADLIQIGLAALFEAARGFEERGVAFAPYAAVRVRGAMIDELRRASTGSRQAASSRREIEKTRKILEQKYHRVASDAEMAKAMALTAEEYQRLIQQSQYVQIAPLVDEYSDLSLAFADAADGADIQIEKQQLRDRLATAIGQLTQREAIALQLYFVEELTLEEIGHVLDVGAARVCQIKRSALLKLRGMMEGEG